jgi:hypothetical protein
MQRMTLAEAHRRDKFLHDLAVYEVTKGLMITKISQEGILNLYSQVAHKFNYFKRLIQSGEYTIEELEDFITSKYAAIASPKLELGIDKIDEYMKEFDEREDVDQISVNAKSPEDLFGDVFRMFFEANQGKFGAGKGTTDHIMPEDQIDEDSESDDEDGHKC